MFAHHGGSLVIDICRNVWVIIMVTLNIKAHGIGILGGKKNCQFKNGLLQIEMNMLSLLTLPLKTAISKDENGNLKRCSKFWLISSIFCACTSPFVINHS